MDLSAQLLQMIHAVSQSDDVRTASVNLLHPLLKQLDMDQAAFCEQNQNEIIPVFAMDRTRQILKKEDLWLSQTLIQRALETMEPVTHIQGDETDGESIPQSLHKYSLRYVVVLPVSAKPLQVVHLASQRSPARKPGSEELDSLRIATQAAVLALQQHRNFVQLREENRGLIAKLKCQERQFLHASPAMEGLVQEVRRVAPFNISILLQGESGSGKEEVALLTHQASGRTGRFIAVNCANLTESLLESELFGHTKGAFTGAVQQKNGLLAEANEGTFFLDEIGELPLGLQAKLLRVIQERSMRPLGASKEVPLNLRFIAASHRDLWTLVQEKKFREDLYYRIQEMTVTVPPLRRRPEDIALLSQYFVRGFSQEFNLPHRTLGEDALAALRTYSWPGNVRELKNICRTTVILSKSQILSAADIRLPGGHASRKPESQIIQASPAEEIRQTGDGMEFVTRVQPETDLCLRTVLEDLEKKIIHAMLEKDGATQALVAKRLGISIRTLQRSLQ